MAGVPGPTLDLNNGTVLVPASNTPAFRQALIAQTIHLTEQTQLEAERLAYSRGLPVPNGIPHG